VVPCNEVGKCQHRLAKAHSFNLEAMPLSPAPETNDHIQSVNPQQLHMALADFDISMSSYEISDTPMLNHRGSLGDYFFPLEEEGQREDLLLGHADRSSFVALGLDSLHQF